MSRASLRRPAVGISLFPFLAVLICTMGALIMLLVLLVQGAQVQAAAVVAQEQAAAQLAAAAPAAADDALQQQREAREEHEWRRQILEQQRQEKTEELAGKRQQLSHLEDHIRRLQEQARQLLTQARQVDEGQTLRDDELAAARAERDRLRREIEAAQARLEAARAKQAAAEKFYALIPYEGPQGTRRRPIYIECTQEGIILQPEGVVLLPDDFQGPLGPGNPLDAALRAKREYLERAGVGGEAYPLLVVRPDGVVAYVVARSAMKAWDDEFGYELVEADKQLAFGSADPNLAQMLQRTVKSARQRQSALAAAMPRRYKEDDPLLSFRAEDQREIAAEMASAGGAPGGHGVGGGTGGAGVGYSEKFADGQGPRTPPGSAPGQPGQPTGPYSAGQPGEKVQHGGDPRKAGVAGGVAGATNGQGMAGAAAPARRGHNWGLPGAQGKQTAVTRPIRVSVQTDRLVLVPERGDSRAPQVIPLAGASLSVKEVDAFVTAVNKQMQSWGLAVAGGYWKPVLKVEVAQAAEARFHQLETALAGSGFDVQRASP